MARAHVQTNASCRVVARAITLHDALLLADDGDMLTVNDAAGTPRSPGAALLSQIPAAGRIDRWSVGACTRIKR